jgi:non-heme chloroperoxidase
MLRKQLFALLSLPFAVSAVLADTEQVVVQSDFDVMGAPVHHWSNKGKDLFYVDEGPKDGIPVVFVAGNGTSARALELTNFLRSTRDQLKLRFITLERNGFGQSTFDPKGDYSSYSADVRELLGHLGVDHFSLLAISGGGPYVAQIAADLAPELRSIHYAAAYSQPGVSKPEDRCKVSDEQLAITARPYTVPTQWWAMPAGNSVERIPGWEDAAYDDGMRTFFMKGSQGFDMKPLVHEWRLYCEQPVASGQKIKAPVFIYGGTADAVVPPEHMKFWSKHYSNIGAVRSYPGEGHDVQYRHWGQIITDIAYQGERTLVCDHGQSLLLTNDKAQQRLSQGATLDVCAWQKSE